jgi:anaerobic ribonucleoside-triphosphate reductase activating protein
MSEYLRIFHKQAPVKVLGPYQRAVIWLQGCNWGCHGCIVPESWSLEGGELITISELRDWILAQDTIEGVTFSGGEPMLQAEGLLNLIEEIQNQRDLGIVCYTGYTLEYLQNKGSVSQQKLFTKIDLLIDGLYQESNHGDLLWRGSSNQRLFLLSSRYQIIIQEYLKGGESSAGLEFQTDINGELSFVGVPNLPNFRQQFEQKMHSLGVKFQALSS